MTAHERGLLDTSVVVSLGGVTDIGDLPARCFVSATTLAELSVGPLLARTDTERAGRQSVLQQVEADFHALPFDDRAARAFGQVAAQLRASGHTTTAHAHDALVAATAARRRGPRWPSSSDCFRWGSLRVESCAERSPKTPSSPTTTSTFRAGDSSTWCGPEQSRLSGLG